MADEEPTAADRSRPESPAKSSGVADEVIGDTRHPATRYEPRDVRFRGVVLVIVVAIILGGADLYVVWRLFHERQQGLRERSTSRYPLALDREPALPNAPRLERLDRLQGSQSGDVYRRGLSEELLLATYGFTSDEGYVHVPIQRAMELVIGELPSRRQEPPTAKDTGLVDSGESNSGRMFRGPPQ